MMDELVCVRSKSKIQRCFRSDRTHALAVTRGDHSARDAEGEERGCELRQRVWLVKVRQGWGPRGRTQLPA